QRAAPRRPAAARAGRRVSAGGECGILSGPPRPAECQVLQGPAPQGWLFMASKSPKSAERGRGLLFCVRSTGGGGRLAVRRSFPRVLFLWRFFASAFFC